MKSLFVGIATNIAKYSMFSFTPSPSPSHVLLKIHAMIMMNRQIPGDLLAGNQLSLFK